MPMPKPAHWRRSFAATWNALSATLSAGIDQVEAEFTQVRDRTSRLRLLPTGAIFPLLERAVRDAAQSLKKEVLFESFGGDIRLDAHVLAALRDALLHVVRNAVAHGIESQARAHRPLARRSRVVSNCGSNGVETEWPSSAVTTGEVSMWKRFAGLPFAGAWWRPRMRPLLDSKKPCESL